MHHASDFGFSIDGQLPVASDPEPIVITLKDLCDWRDFVADNREALEDEYGTVEQAMRHALDGGLVLGGGAAPLFHVCFEG